MAIKKFLISVFLLAILIFTIIACSGTKSICPAYSLEKTEVPTVQHS
jgi:hypothetical protein